MRDRSDMFTRVLACPDWAFSGEDTLALSLRRDESPSEAVLDEFDSYPHGRGLEAIECSLADAQAVRLLIYDSYEEPCVEEILAPLATRYVRVPGQDELRRYLCVGNTLEHSCGSFGAWTLEHSERANSPAAAWAELEALVNPADDALALIERHSARDDVLLAAVQAAEPNTLAPWHIYADFLQLRGDHRGTLAALQLRDPDDPRVQAQLDSMAVELFGPLAPLLSDPELDLVWTAGWITQMRFGPIDFLSEDLQLHLLEALLRLPVSACLRTLEVKRRGDVTGFGARPLERTACRASLRSISFELGNLRLPALDLGELPRLERLVVAGDFVDLQASMPSLRELELRGAELESVRDLLYGGALGSVRGLRLGVSTRVEEDLEYFSDLLRAPALASLESLSLHSALVHPFDSAGLFEDAWIDELLACPLLATLAERDFSKLSMGNSDRKRLRDHCTRLPGRSDV